jgi:hypothetical protein
MSVSSSSEDEESSGKFENCDECDEEFNVNDTYQCGHCGDGPYCEKCERKYLTFYQLPNSDYGRVCEYCERQLSKSDKIIKRRSLF